MTGTFLGTDFWAQSFITKSNDDSYRVYLGTFETPELAAKQAGKVSEFGMKPIVKTHKFSPKDTWHRVTIDNFASKKEALEMVTLLLENSLVAIP